MNIDQIKEKMKKIPITSGIYIFRNSKNNPIYIGKALNLKNRIKSYLHTEDIRLQRMVNEASKINFIETKNDIEALILESQYIKRYRPPFNIMLKDDKQYFYVIFTKEKFPKIFLSHQPVKILNSNTEIRNNIEIPNNQIRNDLKFKKFRFSGFVSDFRFRASNFQYIGPFTDGNALKTTLRLLRRIFPYCTCKQLHNNYCLNYHINKCPGFCCLKQQKPSLRPTAYSLQPYRRNIKAVKDILSGKRKLVTRQFEKEMQRLGKDQRFEEAIALQNKIKKLKRVFQNAQIINKNPAFMIYHKGSRSLELLQKVLNLPYLPTRIEAYDIANIQGKHATGAMVVFTNGQPNKNEYRKFKIYTKDLPDDVGMLKEVLIRRFNHPEWSMPDLLLIDGGKNQFNTAKKIIKNIPIISLAKNDRRKGNKIIFGDGKELSLSMFDTSVRDFLVSIDFEAHRFAISYYRTRHRQSLKFYH